MVQQTAHSVMLLNVYLHAKEATKMQSLGMDFNVVCESLIYIHLNKAGHRLIVTTGDS